MDTALKNLGIEASILFRKLENLLFGIYHKSSKIYSEIKYHHAALFRIAQTLKKFPVFMNR